MATMGRPRAEIDQKQFESLCGMQCTREELCAWFKVTEKTLEAFCKRTYGKGFSLVFAEKREVGKISLRRAGFQLAQKNAAVHIFYCKNFLKMADVVAYVDADKRREELKEIFKGIDNADQYDTEKIFTEQTPEDDNR